MIRSISSEVPHMHDRKNSTCSTITLSRAHKKAWLVPNHAKPSKPSSLWPKTNTASYRFLFSNFRYSFTLFSKFFSSFPHGTCSLSVSHPYLALDGIYHPLGAITLLGGRFDYTLLTKKHDGMTSPDYNSEDFQSELFRLHSQLLTESLLVSFPPLSYMLKFSGYSCLIGGPIG